MTFPLRDGVAVVTGAAKGIGAALAMRLASRGCRLALVDRDRDALAAVASAARRTSVAVSEHAADVADPAAADTLREAVLAEHARASVLINNAGVALLGRFDEVSLADMEWLFAINFWGTVRMCKAFLPVLRREPVAQIVNLSSIFGIVAPAGQTAYAASKFAVRGFSEALRHELEDTGVGPPSTRRTPPNASRDSTPWSGRARRTPPHASSRASNGGKSASGSAAMRSGSICCSGCFRSPIGR